MPCEVNGSKMRSETSALVLNCMHSLKSLYFIFMTPENMSFNPRPNIAKNYKIKTRSGRQVREMFKKRERREENKREEREEKRREEKRREENVCGPFDSIFIKSRYGLVEPFAPVWRPLLFKQY